MGRNVYLEAIGYPSRKPVSRKVERHLFGTSRGILHDLKPAAATGRAERKQLTKAAREAERTLASGPLRHDKDG